MLPNARPNFVLGAIVQRDTAERVDVSLTRLRVRGVFVGTIEGKVEIIPKLSGSEWAIFTMPIYFHRGERVSLIGMP